MRRLEALTPLSMAEIQADKDQLRAEFAMSTRRLEMSVEQMKAKTTSQLAEIGKKSEAIGRLKLELGEKTAAVFALEAKEKPAHRGPRGRAEANSRRETATLARDRAERSPSTQAELARAHQQFQRVLADRRQPARRAGGAARPDRSAEGPDRELRERDQGPDTSGSTARRRRPRRPRGSSSTSAPSTEQLGNPDRRARAPADRADHRSRVLGRRVQELGARLEEQGRFLAEREFASDRLRNEATAAHKTEADCAPSSPRPRTAASVATETLSSEKAQLEEQLRQSQEERAKLQREIAP